MLTEGTGFPESRQRVAAKAAAVAQGPVVKPVRIPRRRIGAGSSSGSSIVDRDFVSHCRQIGHRLGLESAADHDVCKIWMQADWAPDRNADAGVTNGCVA